uniref:Uncharacterized protein n=1 Tax=Strigops habroptila TaxID=2489341 RepID=A0A672UHX3_STRHB
IATYSTAKGLKIHEPYQDRLNFTSLVLNETSITFWDARMNDSGCYMCLFNTFPYGSFSGQTCLSPSVMLLASQNPPSPGTSCSILLLHRRRSATPMGWCPSAVNWRSITLRALVSRT